MVEFSKPFRGNSPLVMRGYARQTMDEKVPKLGTDYADYNRLCFADTPSINCDILNDMGVRRQIERISMRMTEVKI